MSVQSASVEWACSNMMTFKKELVKRRDIRGLDCVILMSNEAQMNRGAWADFLSLHCLFFLTVSQLFLVNLTRFSQWDENFETWRGIISQPSTVFSDHSAELVSFLGHSMPNVSGIKLNPSNLYITSLGSVAHTKTLVHCFPSSIHLLDQNIISTVVWCGGFCFPANYSITTSFRFTTTNDWFWPHLNSTIQWPKCLGNPIQKTWYTRKTLYNIPSTTFSLQNLTRGPSPEKIVKKGNISITSTYTQPTT